MVIDPKNLPLLRQTVFELIEQRGAHGATCDEIEAELDLSHQCASPRCTELHQKGLIVDSGRRRVTRNGRRACVYISRSTLQ